MLRKRFPLMVSAGLVCVMSGSYCAAQPASTPSSSATTTQQNTPSRMMMPVAFKLNIDPADMARLAAMMHAGRSMCFVEDLDPGDDSSMIAICGLPASTVSFAP